MAALALLSLLVSLGLELHHADHYGVWIPSTPNGESVGCSDTGEPSTPVCTLCLASGQAGGAALGRPAEVPAAAQSPVRIGALAAALPPQTVELALAGPRAPPRA